MCVAFHIVSVGDFILILEDECNSRQLCWCPDYGLDRDGWRSLEGPTTHLQCLAMQQAQSCSVLGHLLKGLEGFKLMTTVYQYISEKSIHIYLFIYIYIHEVPIKTQIVGVYCTHDSHLGILGLQTNKFTIDSAALMDENLRLSHCSRWVLYILAPFFLSGCQPTAFLCPPPQRQGLYNLPVGNQYDHNCSNVTTGRLGDGWAWMKAFQKSCIQ